MIKKPQLGPMLRLVLGVGRVVSPLAEPLLKRRLAKGKEDPVRWREKLGEATVRRPDGPLVWLHGVGVGEVMALRGLIESLLVQRPDLNFLVTSSARSSGEVFAKNMPPRTQHQYLPLDFPYPATAFLDHWRPDLVVWSDQEIWPRLAVQVARRGVPQAYVAARITQASAKAKARFGHAYGDLYGLLDLRHAQDADTAAHLTDLMADSAPVSVHGSLKAAAAPLREDAALRAALPTDRPIWVAASAHRADVDIALAAQQHALIKDGMDRLLIIAPRDLADADYIAHGCQKLSLTYAQLSKAEMPDARTQVLIADSFGALGTWYRASFAALIGGTFDATNGHNPWEAVAVGCPVLHGPRVKNFANDFEVLNAAQAVRPVERVDDIVTALADPNLQQIATRATDVRDQAARGMEGTTKALLALLKV